MGESILFFFILETHAGFHMVGHPSGGQVADTNIIGYSTDSRIDQWMSIMGDSIWGSSKDGARHFADHGDFD
jgi:hypothetical protein